MSEVPTYAYAPSPGLGQDAAGFQVLNASNRASILSHRANDWNFISPFSIMTGDRNSLSCQVAKLRNFTTPRAHYADLMIKVTVSHERDGQSPDKGDCLYLTKELANLLIGKGDSALG